jgi:hypothetical protein
MTTLAVHPFLMGVLRGDEPDTLLPLAQGAADWEEIFRDATGHGLIALLYGWLKRADIRHRLPASVAVDLEGKFFGLAARNMLLSRELATLLRAFEKRHLLCAPLRGLALAERLYGDITARPMGDLDLLVRKEDLPHVAAIFRDLGYREIDRRTGFAQAFGNTLEFYKDRHGWIVAEPHWTIAYPPFVDRVDMDRVWMRCARGQVVGVETWLLSAEDLLLHLCLHLTHRDVAAPLLWFYEIDRLVRQEQGAFDWSRFVSATREAGLGSLLSRALGMVRALFGTPLPDRILDQLANAPAPFLEGRLVRLLAGGSSVDGKESLAVLFTLKGFRAKLKYALALLFPSPEFMRVEYGLTSGTQLGFAYLRRFRFLIQEGCKGIVRLVA